MILKAKERKAVNEFVSLLIQKMSRQINELVLFGSRARGKAHKDSDIDLIIVSKDFRGKKFRYRAIGFYDHWNLDLPVEFLCYTPEEFNKLKRQITIVKEAVEAGVEI